MSVNPTFCRPRGTTQVRQVDQAQRQIEQALDGQAELDRRLAVFRAATLLAAGTAVPAPLLVQPDQQRATRFQCSVVIFPVGR